MARAQKVAAVAASTAALHHHGELDLDRLRAELLHVHDHRPVRRRRGVRAVAWPIATADPAIAAYDVETLTAEGRYCDRREAVAHIARSPAAGADARARG